MTSSWIDSLNSSAAPWFGSLCRASLQITLYVLVVYALCRLFPKIPAYVRCTLWWLACLKLLVGIVWASPISLPLLSVAPVNNSAQVDAAASPDQIKQQSLISTNAPLISSAPPTVQQAATNNTPQIANTNRSTTPWMLIAIGIWLIGITWRLFIIASQFTKAQELTDGAQYVDRNWIRNMGDRLARRLGLSMAPPIRMSRDVNSPVVVGLRAPTILIPAQGVYDSDKESLQMALAHEMAHVRRHDLWFGLVPTAAQALFFFHPLAWLASREYALAREEACDAEAIQLTGITPHEYGRILLKFGVAGMPSGAVVGIGASKNALQLKRRLETLRYSTLLSSRTATVSLLVFLAVASLAVVPIRLTAKESTQVQPTTASTTPTPDAPPLVSITQIASPKAKDTATSASPADYTQPPAQPATPSAPDLPAPAPAAAAVATPAPTTSPAPAPAAAPKPAPTAKDDEDDSDNSVNEEDSKTDESDSADDKNDPADSSDISKAVDEAVNQAMRTVNSSLNHLVIPQINNIHGPFLSDKIRQQIKQAEKESIDSHKIERQAKQTAILSMKQALASLEDQQKDYSKSMKALNHQYPNAADQDEHLKNYLAAEQLKKEGIDLAVKSLRRSLIEIQKQQPTSSSSHSNSDDSDADDSDDSDQ